MCVSSLGTAYMGAYESMKAAQVHLATTLDAELEGSGVYALTIGPGFVPTETALSAIPKLAALMGITLDELQAILKEHTISVEAAGAGFAAAVVLAKDFHGQEISSPAALVAAGIEVQVGASHARFGDDDFVRIVGQANKVRVALDRQYQGYKRRSIFEQQWIHRTFRKHAGASIDEVLEKLSQVEQAAEARDAIRLAAARLRAEGLAAFHAHMHEMAKGYIKDPGQRAEQLATVWGWKEDADVLAALLRGG